jgi:hypothetical protein
LKKTIFFFLKGSCVSCYKCLGCCVLLHGVSQHIHHNSWILSAAKGRERWVRRGLNTGRFA